MIVLLVVLLPRGWSVKGVIIAIAAGHFVATIMLLSSVARLLRGEDQGEGQAGLDRARLVRFSLPFALIGLLIVIVWRQSETLFLAHYWGPEITGFFDLAYRVPQMVLEFVPGAIWPLIMAGFSEAFAKDRDSLCTAIERYYKMLFLLSTPICVFGVVLGGRIVPILFSETMSPAAVPTQVFFAIFTVSFFATPLSMALYVLEKSHVNLMIYLVLAFINVGLDVLLIPKWGIVGAMIPVGFVILISPFIYKRVLARFVEGVRIPFGFIGRCFLASSPILLMLPLAGLVRGVVELLAAFLIAAFVVALSVKKLKLIGKEESDMLGSIPIPAAGRLLKFMST
jgi:O-antigen/teichoic acid export membrane protein